MSSKISDLYPHCLNSPTRQPTKNQRNRLHVPALIHTAFSRLISCNRFLITEK